MPDPNLVATVIAEGQRYSQWESVMVRWTYGVTMMDFMLTASEPVPSGTGWGNIRLKPGDPVTILLGGIQAIGGPYAQIVSRTTNYDAQTHTIVVQGKSNDPIRSSIQVKPGNFNGYTFEQAARAVLGQVGIPLSIVNPPAIVSKPFTKLSVQYGETVAEFVERIAMMRGMFLSGDPQGNLVASSASSTAAGSGAQLVEGKNILRASCILDNQLQYVNMRFVSQQSDPDAATPPRDTSVTINNQNAGTNRTDLIVAEHPGDTQDLIARANLDAQRNSWTSVIVTIVVPGWKKPDGTLWIPDDGTPKQQVSVYSPMLFPNIDGTVNLFIRSVICQQDSQNGTTTTLELVNAQGLGEIAAAIAGPTSQGNVLGNPNPPAQEDPPDYQSKGNDYPGGVGHN
jgi:prophage tail gpP-like protein